MKQDIFNLCLWLTTVLMIIIIISIIINKINKLSKQISINNLTYNCNKNTLPEHFEPYDGSYTNGFSVNNVLCSDLDVSKSLNTTANINFYDTSQYSNKTDTNKTITLSSDGNASGIKTLSSTNIINSNKITTKDITNTNIIETKDINISNAFKITNKDNIKINDTKLFDLIYPIGSIYTSTNLTSPATLFGGTWEQIKDKFLYTASSDSTKTGGASTVTLTTENMPSHNHTFSGNSMQGTINALVRYDDSDQGNYETSGVFSNTNKSGGHTWKGKDGGGAKMTIKFSATPSGSISHTGGDKNNWNKTKPFSIMPPYYKVYCWRRTAL